MVVTPSQAPSCRHLAFILQAAEIVLLRAATATLSSNPTVDLCGGVASLTQATSLQEPPQALKFDPPGLELGEFPISAISLPERMFLSGDFHRWETEDVFVPRGAMTRLPTGFNISRFQRSGWITRPRLHRGTALHRFDQPCQRAQAPPIGHPGGVKADSVHLLEGCRRAGGLPPRWRGRPAPCCIARAACSASLPASGRSHPFSGAALSLDVPIQAG